MTKQKINLVEADELLTFCDSYSRLPAILRLANSMSESEWLKLLGENWSICDNIGLNKIELLESPLFARVGVISEMMTASALKFYRDLPCSLTIFRGCYENNFDGFSWTTGPEIAKSFPFLNRYKQKNQAILVEAEVRKKDILAVITDRDEIEIITYKPKVISITPIRLAAEPPAINNRAAL